MDVHNTSEDVVFKAINEICDALEQEHNSPGICTCNQCRLNTACFVLNRIAPHYIISNRGAARVNKETIEWQQQEADIIALVHEGIKRVNHNQRPDSTHKDSGAENQVVNKPVFNLPTIVGRIFNGINFEPLSDIIIELYEDGELIKMKENWQNPYTLVKNLAGCFTFWPESIPAEKENIHRTFKYSIEIEAPGMESLHHFFQIPVTSEAKPTRSFSMNRTFKCQDLYMFPTGGDEMDS
ncbi:MAG: late competence development ComFB family protein [Spirochaetaceae bacterium]|jgi:competence protein ComFB|nr:late competence development ComFB family protein [Spirochaetaceae bacterium]